MTKSEIIAAVRAVVESAEKMKNAYFFSPPGSAGSRRSYEKRYSAPRVEWKDGKDEFSAEFTVSCSCSYVYAYGLYTRNGKKTTLTAVRNSLKRLEANA